MRFQYKTLEQVVIGRKYGYLTPSAMVARGFPPTVEAEAIGKTAKRVLIRFHFNGKAYLRHVTPANLRDF